MSMKLLDLYKSVLATAGLISTEDGFVKMKSLDSTKPATIKGKSLVLPTPEHLANPDWSNRVIFHPLFENVMRGESEVLALYRQAINIKLNTVVGVMAVDLLRLATSPAQHAKLNPDQSEYLSRVKNADEKTIDTLAKLMTGSVKDTQRAFIHVFLKRTGKVAGKQYARVGVVNFPLYNELKKDQSEVFGIKLRRKDRESILALLEYIFPRIDEPEAYNRGSSSDIAPSMEALMKAVAGVAGPLNDVLSMYSNVFDQDNIDQLEFNDEWVAPFENLTAFLPQIRAIPMLPGNEGAVKLADASVTPVTPPQAAQPAQPIHATPVQFANTPIAQPPSPPPQQQVPIWQQQQIQPPPAVIYPPMQMQQYQQALVPQVKTPDGKINFDAMVASSPALQAQVYQGMTHGGFGVPAGPAVQMVPMQRQPGWARPQVQQPQQQFGQPTSWNTVGGGGGSFGRL